MESRFTVKFFKRVITFAVIGLISALVVTVIVFGARLGTLKDNQESLLKQVEKGGDNQIETATMKYQKEYPQMYVERDEVSSEKERNTVYLTFDDGPSSKTLEVLDILKRNNIKATFFMVYEDSYESKEIIQRVIDEGHTIGIHSYSHNYEKIYASVDAYLEDFHKLWSYLKDEFGYECKIFRFPGGSINTYNLNVYNRIIPEMYRRGFTFYDWNASAQDAISGHIGADEIERSIVKEVRRNEGSIILMHDSEGKNATVTALTKIIKTLKADGYVFKTLNNSVAPVTFTG